MKGEFWMQRRAITERDKEILTWVNRQGFAKADQIGRAFGMSKVVTYRRLGALKQWKMIESERILGGVGVWYLTYQGVELIDSPLKPVRKISLATFEHELALIDIQLNLLSRYEGSEWITTRELKAEEMKKTIFTKGNLKRASASKEPDGILLLSGKNRVAIEYEKTLKNKTRIKDKLREYDSQVIDGKLRGIAYYTPKKSIQNTLMELLNDSHVLNKDFFKVIEYKGDISTSKW
jgi:hypothetical protein